LQGRKEHQAQHDSINGSHKPPKPSRIRRENLASHILNQYRRQYKVRLALDETKQESLSSQTNRKLYDIPKTQQNASQRVTIYANSGANHLSKLTLQASPS
tara:strand:- start:741 stop:1043 length:303 start_codon:yes stop_codon:yes gene_type:complete